MNAGSAIIDGEVIVPSANGVSEFSVLQNELRRNSKKPRAGGGAMNMKAITRINRRADNRT